MILSVIIPTRNRASFLDGALNSLCNQSCSSDLFEVIVIDNGSTDATFQICKKYKSKILNYRFFLKPNPGLHIGRHLGARKAKGEILVYIDDDIVADKGWLQAIANAFKDDSVALAGGKILPKWEGDIPDWLKYFERYNEHGWWLGYLSLLDFGNEVKEIPPHFVFGCNFSIRKNVLFDCGGFHPDAMPQELIRFRGDGETGLSIKISQKKFKTLYVPSALVYHRVPKDRLTVDYFCRRAFNQGVSDSYTTIRRNGAVKIPHKKNPAWEWKTPLRYCKRAILRLQQLAVQKKDPYRKVKDQVQSAYKAGYSFHQKEVRNDPELLNWVLKEDYWDYRLPQVKSSHYISTK